jgi:hypothetical protein
MPSYIEINGQIIENKNNWNNIIKFLETHECRVKFLNKFLHHIPSS